MYNKNLIIILLVITDGLQCSFKYLIEYFSSFGSKNIFSGYSRYFNGFWATLIKQKGSKTT